VRFLLVSDLHYRLRQFDWLLARASAVDAVVIPGGMLDIRSAVALDVQAVAVTAALRELAGRTNGYRHPIGVGCSPCGNAGLAAPGR
jgi:hypothetical protein